jgi:hypothetical protein
MTIDHFSLRVKTLLGLSIATWCLLSPTAISVFEDGSGDSGCSTVTSGTPADCLQSAPASDLEDIV